MVRVTIKHYYCTIEQMSFTSISEGTAITYEL